MKPCPRYQPTINHRHQDLLKHYRLANSTIAQPPEYLFEVLCNAIKSCFFSYVLFLGLGFSILVKTIAITAVKRDYNINLFLKEHQDSGGSKRWWGPFQDYFFLFVPLPPAALPLAARRRQLWIEMADNKVSPCITTSFTATLRIILSNVTLCCSSHGTTVLNMSTLHYIGRELHFDCIRVVIRLPPASTPLSLSLIPSKLSLVEN